MQNAAVQDVCPHAGPVWLMDTAAVAACLAHSTPATWMTGRRFHLRESHQTQKKGERLHETTAIVPATSVVTSVLGFQLPGHTRLFLQGFLPPAVCLDLQAGMEARGGSRLSCVLGSPVGWDTPGTARPELAGAWPDPDTCYC